MYSRVALTLLIFLLGWLAYQGLSRLVLSRRGKGDLLIDEYQPGRLAILYFSSPDCVPCKTIQRPALERLMDSLKDDIQLKEIDVTNQPDLTDAWGGALSSYNLYNRFYRPTPWCESRRRH